MRKLILLFVLFAAPAFAQSPLPAGVTAEQIAAVRASNPSVFDSDAAVIAWGRQYWGWIDAPVSAPAAPPDACYTFKTATVCALDDCRHVNVYIETDKAVACAHWSMARYVPPPAPAYRLGQPVRHAYGMEAVVIGITRTLAGVEVLTLEITRSYSNLQVGDVLAQTNGVGNPWLAVAHE